MYQVWEERSSSGPMSITPTSAPQSSIKSAIITEEDAEKEEICSDIDSLKG